MRRNVMLGVFHRSFEESIEITNKEISRLAPSFGFSASLIKSPSDLNSAFPFEHFERVMPRFLRILESQGINGLESEIVGHSSMNALLRKQLAEGKF